MLNQDKRNQQYNSGTGFLTVKVFTFHFPIFQLYSKAILPIRCCYYEAVSHVLLALDYSDKSFFAPYTPRHFVTPREGIC